MKMEDVHTAWMRVVDAYMASFPRMVCFHKAHREGDDQMFAATKEAQVEPKDLSSSHHRVETYLLLLYRGLGLGFLRISRIYGVGCNVTILFCRVVCRI